MMSSEARPKASAWETEITAPTVGARQGTDNAISQRMGAAPT
jgi:hypothetical protein